MRKGAQFVCLHILKKVPKLLAIKNYLKEISKTKEEKHHALILN
jgi:hypothetical protein